MSEPSKLPITVLLAVKNESVNLPKCLNSLREAEKVIILDSKSTDGTIEIAEANGASVVQFAYSGGYPKKRQWAMDTLDLNTPWLLLIDADEVVPPTLWSQIRAVVSDDHSHDGFLIKKGFHFLGRKMRFGGFSHEAVLLLRRGKGRFERLVEDAEGGMDMEVHERIIVTGSVGRLSAPLIHEDFKGLEAYIARHNKYSTWEANLRYGFLEHGVYGVETIRPRLFGNSQERRRWLKAFIIRLPFEPWLWFFYHYIVRLGVLEGNVGLIACQIRMSYIQQARAKIFELRLKNEMA